MPTRRYGRISLTTSREEKVLFPGSGISKGDLIDYYERAWERMKPHLADRALVMQRFPDGIERDGFYQKQVADHFPDWLQTARVHKGGEGSGESQDLVVCHAKAALAYLADQACVTPHLWLSRRDRLDVPDQLVFDLDPPGDDFAPAREAALRCRDLLEELGLAPFVKVTGSKGVHVTVPLRREEGFDAVRELARDAARLLAGRQPEALTTEQRRAKRRGRLYLDVGRNAYAQTVVAPYGVRARPDAPVAVPLAWEELSDRRIDARSFPLARMAGRLDDDDPWAGWRRRACGLGGARRALARLAEEE